MAKSIEETVKIEIDGAVVEIGKKDGRMTALELTKGGLGRWNVIPGRLEIVDELQPGKFRDGMEKCEVSVRKSGKGRVTVSKRFKKSKFTVTEKWSSEKDHIVWSVSVKLDKGQEARSVRIRQFIPWPTSEPYGWKVWMAQ